jgi:hypothetical protein
MSAVSSAARRAEIKWYAPPKAVFGLDSTAQFHSRSLCHDAAAGHIQLGRSTILAEGGTRTCNVDRHDPIWFQPPGRAVQLHSSTKTIDQSDLLTFYDRLRVLEWSMGDRNDEDALHMAGLIRLK